jgi:hypothetical protein
MLVLHLKDKTRNLFVLVECCACSRFTKRDVRNFHRRCFRLLLKKYGVCAHVCVLVVSNRRALKVVMW